MRTIILITLMALFTISCASRRDVAVTQDNNNFDVSYQHGQTIDGSASRIR